MKHIFRVIFAAILLPLTISAMEKLQGFCEQGGYTVSTGGVASTTKVQKSFPSCTVTVYNVGTLNLSTIYSDDSATAKANPFTAASTGYWFFYAANGNYDVKFSGGGIPAPFTLGDFQLQDLGTGGITSLGAQTGATQTFATGTSGTNFAISSAGNVHTFNIPSSSAANRGLLLAADWTTFNAKESVITFSAPLVRTVNTITLTAPLTIAQGGTNGVAKTAAFDNLSPTTAKGDIIANNGTNNTKLAVGADGLCLKASSGAATGLVYASCTGATPIPVASGGTGAASLTGVVIGNITSAMTATAASAQLQYLRRTPNVTGTTYTFGTPPVLLQSDFNFTAQAPGGSLTATVGASATLTPCPLGVNGADTDHYLWISGGTGTAERILITGGTCTSGAATGTVTFTPANNHTGAWTIGSYSLGAQEVALYAAAGAKVMSHVTVTYADPQFVANGTSAVVKIWRLPAKGEIHQYTIKHSQVVGDGGGAMSAVTVSLGSSGSATTYTAAKAVGEDTAAADTTFYSGAPSATRYTWVADTVLATFTSTGANFGNGTVTSLTTGSVDIWIEWMVLP